MGYPTRHHGCFNAWSFGRKKLDDLGQKKLMLNLNGYFKQQTFMVISNDNNNNMVIILLLLNFYCYY